MFLCFMIVIMQKITVHVLKFKAFIFSINESLNTSIFYLSLINGNTAWLLSYPALEF